MILVLLWDFTTICRIQLSFNLVCITNCCPVPLKAKNSHLFEVMLCLDPLSCLSYSICRCLQLYRTMWICPYFCTDPSHCSLLSQFLKISLQSDLGKLHCFSLFLLHFSFLFFLFFHLTLYLNITGYSLA